MSDSNSNIKRHSFQPGAMSIIQMGEQLIGHPSTAINELVKNGYDADATSSKVFFSYANDSADSFAIIYDNGSGMDYNTLFGDWLKPSVSSKRTPGSKSETFKRNMLGSKGIGRLAAMALGENITVITRRTPDVDYNWITVNREAFRDDVLLSKVNFPGDKISNYIQLFSNSEITEERKTSLNPGLINFLKNATLDSFGKGTLIIVEHLDSSVMKNLREDYNQIEIPQEFSYKNTTFYKALATLITPLNLNSVIQKELLEKGLISIQKTIADPKSKFSIEFGTNLLPDYDEQKIEWLPIVSIPIQSAYDYRVYGKVSDVGDVSGLISYNRLDNNVYEEKFEITAKEVVEKNEAKQEDLFNEPEIYETGEYYFDIRIYDVGEKDNLEKLAKQANLKTGSEFRSTFKSFQGMRISKNGFGVKPYGEEVEDWIGLSKARVQNPGRNVNTNQILGYVFFHSPENDSLEEKTNREGFLENKAFQQVKDTMEAIFSNLGKRRYNYRLLHGLGRVPTSKHQRPDFEEYLSTLTHLHANRDIVNYSEKFMKEVTTSMDNIEESLSFSERLASLGSGIELVYHEMAQPISELRTAKSSFEIKKDKMSFDALDDYIKDIDALKYSIEVLTQLRKSLQPAIGRTRAKKFSVYSTFLKVCNLYKSDMEEFNISTVADSKLQSYEINDLEYAFWIAFLNIINNAVYWIKKSEKPGEIIFSMEAENFVISNTGPYINEELIDHIFDYGITTRSEKNATGLGLAFTQSILSRNGWDITGENRKIGPAFIIKKNSNG